MLCKPDGIHKENSHRNLHIEKEEGLEAHQQKINETQIKKGKNGK